jgi:hypothetical protein
MSRPGQKRNPRKQASIFVSHYAQDVDLARAVVILLERICGNDLRVFMSSDISRGIPYSKPWFQMLLSEIDHASAMICILTSRSIDRPWVFWEAGAAFGKGKPVYGLAIGIGVQEACVGPFAQFQSCSDDRLHLIGLMKTLLLRIRKPANEYLVRKAVQDFLQVKRHVLSEVGQRQVSDRLQPDRDVALFLQSIDRSLFAVDGMIEICRSIGYSGWTTKDMAPPRIEGRRSLPKVFYSYRGRDARWESGSQARFTLKSITEPLQDAGRSRIRTVLALSTYADLYRLSRLLDRPFIKKHGTNHTARELYGSSWFPIEGSPLVHNVNAQPIIITRDHFVLLVKRSLKVHYYLGCWSASMEEQMVAPGDEVNKDDATIFDCAERGVREELACTPDPSTTRILSVGIEHANMSASFVCLVRVEETFVEACERWLKKARDPYEAAALDGLPLAKKDLEHVLNQRQYHPSSRVFVRTDGTAGDWHPTARMRLYALMCHIEDAQQDAL